MQKAQKYFFLGLMLKLRFKEQRTGSWLETCLETNQTIKLQRLTKLHLGSFLKSLSSDLGFKIIRLVPSPLVGFGKTWRCETKSQARNLFLLVAANTSSFHSKGVKTILFWLQIICILLQFVFKLIACCWFFTNSSSSSFSSFEEGAKSLLREVDKLGQAEYFYRKRVANFFRLLHKNQLEFRLTPITLLL